VECLPCLRITVQLEFKFRGGDGRSAEERKKLTRIAYPMPAGGFEPPPHLEHQWLTEDEVGAIITIHEGFLSVLEGI
jgi:hypothetical protein